MPEVKDTCPRCRKNASFNYNEGVWYCFHCHTGGKTRPTTRTTIGKHPIQVEFKDLSEEGFNFLQKFPNAPIKRFRSGFTQFGEYIAPDTLSVLKPLTKAQHPLTLKAGNELYINEDNPEVIVIVEDFISGLCIWEAGFSVLVLHGTHLQSKNIPPGQKILWLDGDAPGYKAARLAVIALGSPCIFTKQDPKYYDNDEILTLIQEKL